MIGKSFVTIFLASASLLAAAGCQASTRIVKDGELAGNWTGESICQIKPSPCNDEKVIYRVTEPDASGKLTVQMDKVVNGEPEMMGVLDCIYRKDDHSLKCEMPNGTWEYTVSGDTMTGTLTLTDKRLYRRISVKKESRN